MMHSKRMSWHATSWGLAALVCAIALILVLARPVSASTSSLETGTLGTQDDVTVYIADRENDRVVSVPAGGGPVTELVTGLSAPVGLAVSGNILYIVDSGNDRIVSVPTTGGPITELVTGVDGASGIAIADDTMYITDVHHDRILSAPTVGGVATEVASVIGGPAAVAVAGETLFVTVPSTNKVIAVSTRDGLTTELASGLSSPSYIAVSGNTLYITDSTRHVATMSTAGGAVTKLNLFSTLRLPSGIAVHGHRVFFADWVDNRVISTSTSGGAVTELVTGLDHPEGVAVGEAPCQGSSCVPVVGSAFGSLG